MVVVVMMLLRIYACIFSVHVFLLEFSRLCQQWGAFEWEWLNAFRADMALYKVCPQVAVCRCV